MAGVTDHITPWKGVYKTAQIMGEGTTFVLSNSGHLQSLLNPPSNPKASFIDRPGRHGQARRLHGRGREAQGKLVARLARLAAPRSGDEKSSTPAALGSARHPSLGRGSGDLRLLLRIFTSADKAEASP